MGAAQYRLHPLLYLVSPWVGLLYVLCFLPHPSSNEGILAIYILGNCIYNIDEFYDKFTIYNTKNIYAARLTRPGDEVGFVSMRVTCEDHDGQSCLSDGPCIFLTLFELRFLVGSNRVSFESGSQISHIIFLVSLINCEFIMKFISFY